MPRITTGPEFLPRVYLQGFAEDTHGASEPVLSLLPIRAGDIVKSLSDHLATAATAATAADAAEAGERAARVRVSETAAVSTF